MRCYGFISFIVVCWCVTKIRNIISYYLVKLLLSFHSFLRIVKNMPLLLIIFISIILFINHFSFVLNRRFIILIKINSIITTIFYFNKNLKHRFSGVCTMIIQKVSDKMAYIHLRSNFWL